MLQRFQILTTFTPPRVDPDIFMLCVGLYEHRVRHIGRSYVKRDLVGNLPQKKDAFVDLPSAFSLFKGADL
jgi:hypothetical protein